MVEGEEEELAAAMLDWAALQQSVPDERLLHEVHALRVLYAIDEQATFDMLFSNIALEEIGAIRDAIKRHRHDSLLDRLIEHRKDVYYEEERLWEPTEIEEAVGQIFPDLPEKMRNDALQFCEAVLFEASYFLTNDVDFARLAATKNSGTHPCKVSELRFVSKPLRSWVSGPN